MDANMAQFSTMVAEIRGDIKAINARIDNLQHNHYWELAWFAMILGFVIFVMQYLKP